MWEGGNQGRKKKKKKQKRNFHSGTLMMQKSRAMGVIQTHRRGYPAVYVENLLHSQELLYRHHRGSTLETSAEK
jgi:hypothetical protein